jgi:hypothetical protein
MIREKNAQTTEDKAAAATEVKAIAEAAGRDFAFMLRQAGEHDPGDFRRALVKLVGEAIGGYLNEFRNELDQHAEAIVRLERNAR